MLLLLQLCAAEPSGDYSEVKQPAANTGASNTTTPEIFCLAPLELDSGFLIWEYNLQVPGFDVRVKCDDGYQGKAQVRPCKEFGGRYQVQAAKMCRRSWC